MLLRDRGVPWDRGEHGLAGGGAVRLDRPPAEQGDVGIGHVFAAPQQCGDQRQRSIRGQSARGGGELRAHLGIRLGGGEERDEVGVSLRNLAAITEEAHCPGAHGCCRMRQCRLRGRLVERTALMQRPESLQRGMRGGRVQQRPQRLGRRRIAPFCKKADGCLAVPAVRVTEKRDELRARFRGEIHVLLQHGLAPAHPVYAPALGVAVRHVVAIGIGVEKEMRRLHHPQPAMAAHHGVRHVQPVEHHAMFVESAVAIRVLMHGDDVAPAIVVRRRGRDAVEARTVEAVAAHHLQAGGKRILAVLRDPHAPAFVEADVRRLRDQRLAQDQVRREIGRRLHLRERLGGRDANPRHRLRRRERRGGGVKTSLGESGERRLPGDGCERCGVGLPGEALPCAFERLLIEITREDRRHPEPVARRAAIEPHGEHVELLLLEDVLRHFKPSPLPLRDGRSFRDLLPV